MSETRPTSEQLRFTSSKTGDQVLDTYLEAAERGNRSIPDLMADIFDASGVIRQNLEWRLNAGYLEFRQNAAINPAAQWTPTSTFFFYRGAHAPGTSYNILDYVTGADGLVYLATLTTTVTPPAAPWVLLSPSTIAVGTTQLSGGTNGSLLYNNAGVIGETAAVPSAQGGTGTSTAFTLGSVVFAGSSGVYTQANSQLFWDNTNSRLGVGTASPATKLDVRGNTAITGSLEVSGVIRGQATALTGDVLFIGDNAKLVDINVLDTAGIYSQSTPTIGSLKLGSGGGTISGSNGNIGIGTTTPTAKFDLVGDYKEGVVTANTSTAYTISLANGTFQILTLTGNCVFTFPTATAGQSFMLFLKQDATGSRTVTWPAVVKWPSSTAPTITATASKVDKFVFTADGTNWLGSVAGQNYL